MNQLEQKICYTGIRYWLKRFTSKSPKWAVKIQWAGGVVAALWAAAIMLDQMGVFSFMTPSVHSQFVVITTAIGGMLTGCGIVAKLPSTDPNLVAEELKAAILDQAVQDGTHVPVAAPVKAVVKAQVNSVL
jgi:acyl-CoA reductase-like NAD-dependent aldehyde dehydrogenase